MYYNTLFIHLKYIFFSRIWLSGLQCHYVILNGYRYVTSNILRNACKQLIQLM